MNATLGKTALDNSGHFTDEKTEAQSRGPDMPRATLWSEAAQLALEFPVTLSAQAGVLILVGAVLEGLTRTLSPRHGIQGPRPFLDLPGRPSVRGEEPAHINWGRREVREAAAEAGWDCGQLRGWVRPLCILIPLSPSPLVLQPLCPPTPCSHH